MTDVEVYDPDEPALDKARMVLYAFRDAGLKPPFDFDSGNPERMWAAALMPFDVEPVTAAMGQWVFTEKEFPSIAQFVTLVQYAVKELADELAPPPTLCSECEGVRYVKVIDGSEEVETYESKQRHRKPDGTDDGDPENRTRIVVEHHHMRPCGSCPEMQERHELYLSGLPYPRPPRRRRR
jgi:hypothetical protein